MPSAKRYLLDIICEGTSIQHNSGQEFEIVFSNVFIEI